MPPLYTYLMAMSLSFNTILSQITIQKEAICYLPDGSISPSYSGSSPCNIGAAVKDSMCCALGDRTLTDNIDLCISNGLCMDSNGTYYRASCTDETWESEACLRICMGAIGPNGELEDYSSKNSPVHFCDDGSVCCGSEAAGEACCKKGRGFQLPTIGLSRIVETVTVKFEQEVSTSTSPPASTYFTDTNDIQAKSTNTPLSDTTMTNDPTYTTSTTSTAPSSGPPSSTSTSSQKGPLLPDTVTIAIAISVPVVSISLIITGLLLWDRRRRRNHAQYANNNKTEDIDITLPDTKPPSPAAVEIGSSDTRYEWPTAGQMELYARAYSASRYNRRPPTPVHHVNVYEMY
ncbi:hypothetical protein EYR41_003303 [Orbilia oligospora]|uniref:Uncharacterized protein n=1 Tax=Orbilia oligospora TaxID=2813651 RepID=A0A7C8KKX5_ORBOL|nr:hypothetical protein TWF751_006777 [Orbilia oligospora]TGJ71331.1 hypothetical protein EYR41_003303 [Orbilia oligospora]